MIRSRKAHIAFAVAVMCLCDVEAALTVKPQAGGYSIERDGKPLVTAMVVENGEKSKGPKDVKKSFQRSSRFGKVWNRWLEARDGRYRLEVAERPDGSVEVTFAGEVDPYDVNRARILHLALSAEALDGKGWKGLAGDGRRWKPVRGTFSPAMKMESLHWMTTDGLVFDFNPLGAADFCSAYPLGAVRGVWRVSRYGKSYRFSGGGFLGRSHGGYTAAKVIIRDGQSTDYHAYHFITAYRYPDHLKSSVHLAFGANRRGECYSDGNVEFSESAGHGWLKDGAARRTLKSADEGALYSCVAGHGVATYRFANLRDGFYLFTVEAGNGTGAANRFDVSVNGVPLASGKSVAAGTARQFSRAMHISGGRADVAFKGDWMVSTMAIQPLLGDQEDFSVGRAFWCTDGFEPGSIYCNSETNIPMAFAASDETYALPKQGTECSGRFRAPPSPVQLPDSSMPSLKWLERGQMVKLFSNTATLSELDDPETRRRYIGEFADGKGFSAVMISGMHSRHTFEGRLDAGIESIRGIADEVHRRGMKLIDHHDVTLLWNWGVGLRVLMKRVPELERSMTGGLPAFSLCPNNERFKETYFAYLRKLLDAGVDGFQLDEVEYFKERCVCAACRDRFFADTGWRIPANELDAAWNDPESALRKRWQMWRVKSVTNWFVDLRRRLMDVKPDLVLNMYSTHWGFTTSMSRRGGSSDLIDLGRTVNFFGTEVMPRNSMLSARAILPYRRTYHLLHKMYGTPVWAWFYGGTRPLDYFSWALATMSGHIPLLPDVKPDPKMYVPDYAAFAATPNAMDVVGAEPVARVALLFSVASREWGPNWRDAAEHLGTAQTLEAIHVPYEVIGDVHLNSRDLSKYGMLFVGASECLSDASVAAIRDFAARGGVVRLGALAGTREEIGELRKEWAFRDIFGFEPREDAEGRVEVRAFGKGRMAYDPSCRGEEFEFKELGPRTINKFNPDARREKSFRDELAEFTRDCSAWSVNAPDRVYTALWKERSGDVAIHFLNAMACVPPVGVLPPSEPPSPPFPELADDIVFTVPFKVAKAVATSPDFDGARTLEVSHGHGGASTVTLPKAMLKAYTLVRITK